MLRRSADDKNAREFLRFMEFLNRNFDVEWFDLHDYNIMKRPGGQDWVISDPGLFNI